VHLTSWQVGSGLTYAGRALATLIGSGPQQSLPSYVTVDAMAAYRFSAFGRDFVLQFNAENLLDRQYITDAQAYAFAAVPPYSLTTNIYGLRRSFTGALRADF